MGVSLPIGHITPCLRLITRQEGLAAFNDCLDLTHDVVDQTPGDPSHA